MLSKSIAWLEWVRDESKLPFAPALTQHPISYLKSIRKLLDAKHMDRL